MTHPATATHAPVARPTASASHRADDGAPARGCAAGVWRIWVVMASAHATATAKARDQRLGKGPFPERSWDLVR
jgi:hypothetical protein